LARFLALFGGAALAALPSSGIPTEIGNPKLTYTLRTTVAHQLPGGIDGSLLVTRGPFYSNAPLSIEEHVSPFPDSTFDLEIVVDFGALPFWVGADAPHLGPEPWEDGEVLGTAADLLISQSFRKDEPDATLSFTITEASLTGLDSTPADDVDHVSGQLLIHVVTFKEVGHELFSFTDSAELEGQGRANPGPGPCAPPCWIFEPGAHLPYSVSQGGLDQGYVHLALSAPFTQQVDLSAVGVGQEFTLEYHMSASAFDYAQLDTGVTVRGRDPLNPDSGTYFEFTGLTPTDNPVPEPGRPVLLLAGAAVLAGLRPGRRRTNRPVARRLAELRAFPITHA
jgi:hypothetical protein